MAVTLSEWGVAYGATFGRAHPYNIQVIDPAPVSALEAKYLAVLRVLDIVLRDIFPSTNLPRMFNTLGS